MTERHKGTEQSPEELIAQFEMCMTLAPHADGTQYVLLSTIPNMLSETMQAEIIENTIASGAVLINDIDETQLSNQIQKEAIQVANIDSIQDCVKNLPYTQSFQNLQLSRIKETFYSWISIPTDADKKKWVSFYGSLLQVPENRRQDIECDTWRCIISTNTHVVTSPDSPVARVKRDILTDAENVQASVYRATSINMDLFRKQIVSTYGVDPSQTSEELY